MPDVVERMMTGTWSEHRTLYAQRDATLLLTTDQRADDWATGCGWCGLPLGDHDDMVPVPTADAVLMTPLPPVDPFDAAVLLGNLFGVNLDAAIAQRLTAAAALLPEMSTYTESR
jgi:hypothetical protein